MTPSASISDEIHATLSALIQKQKFRDVESDLIATEALIRKAIEDRNLTPAQSVRLIDCLLILWRPQFAKEIINYLQEIDPESKFIYKVATYLQFDTPTKEDIIKASHCLKSLCYDELYINDLKDSTNAINTIAMRNKIGQLSYILDLGCGTGLVGSVLRPLGFSGTLIGVDLSREMILKAEEKGDYSNIYCMSILDYLSTVSPGSFDGAFFIALGVFLDLSEMMSLLETLFEKVARRGPIIFDLPNTLDIRPNRSNSSTVEPVLQAMRARYTATDAHNRRYYCCRR